MLDFASFGKCGGQFFTVEVSDEFPVCISSVGVDFNSIVLEYFALECFFFCNFG